MRRLTNLHPWMDEQHSYPTDVTELDSILPIYFTKLFAAGLSVGEGSNTLATVLHFWPHARRMLPRSWRAIKGWTKLAPMRTRSQMP
jgi:hypothetical protein